MSRKKLTPFFRDVPLCRASSSSTFEGRVVLTSSGLLDPEGEGITILRNVGNYLSNDRALYPRRMESWTTPVWESWSLQFLQFIPKIYFCATQN